jgi:superoxide dismutase, Cu-Zn family
MDHTSRRRVAVAVALAVTGLVLPSAIGAGSAHANGARVRAEGAFGVTDGAYTYNAAVPAGARARVQAVYTGSGQTVVTLHVWGLLPDRHYGAHAHQNACGPLATDAGAHYQHVVGGATDPAFANPDNEIWLDLATDADGNGSAQTVVRWQFAADRRAGSVVIHDRHTTHGVPGSAGTAGPRHGCLSVGF